MNAQTNAQTIVVVTKNEKKINALKALFTDTPYKIISSDTLNITLPPTAFSGKLAEYLLAKVKYVFDTLPQKSWVIMEGNGLCIPVLDGAPGMHMSTWAGQDATDEDIANHTLHKLRRVEKHRSCIFLTMVAVLSPRGRSFFQRGEVQGVFVPKDEKKDAIKGFPYSGIFKPNGCDVVLSHMHENIRNRFSPKGIAYQNTLRFFNTVKR